jgi:hypothetical protein
MTDPAAQAVIVPTLAYPTFLDLPPDATEDQTARASKGRSGTKKEMPKPHKNQQVINMYRAGSAEIGNWRGVPIFLRKCIDRSSQANTML